MHGMIQTMVSAATSAMARQITSLWDQIPGLCNHNIASMMTRLPPDFLKEHSLDTEADYTFTMKGTNGKCSIMDTVRHYIVPNNLNLIRSISEEHTSELQSPYDLVC